MDLSLLKEEPGKFCAIDASTNSLAFAIFDNTKLIISGKVLFNGKNTYEKVGDACQKTMDFISNFDGIKTIIIEHTIFANSPKTAAQLALVQGAILGGAKVAGVKKIGSVAPITWQNYIGNKALSKLEKSEIKDSHPDKSASWLKTFERGLRKQKTISFVNEAYGTNTDDDDVADAIAIGYWAYHNWDKAFGY